MFKLGNSCAIIVWFKVLDTKNSNHLLNLLHIDEFSDEFWYDAKALVDQDSCGGAPAINFGFGP